MVPVAEKVFERDVGVDRLKGSKLIIKV